MKILILNYEFPPLGGGAGNATENIARELARQGHQPTVLTTWFKGLSPDETVDGYRIIRLSAMRKRKDRSNILEMLHYVFLAARRGKSMLEREKYDHIVSFFALPTGLAAWRLHKRFAVPYTLSLRGGDVPGFLPNDLKWHHRLTIPLTRLVWKGAAHIVANSDSLKELAEKTARPLGRDVLFIPNGVDADLFSPRQADPNVSAGSPIARDRPFRLIFVGRLTPQKGVAFILRALAGIKAEDPQAFERLELSVVGDGPLREPLEREARSLGIGDAVSFLGWLDRSLIPDRLRESDAFVFPSFEEGMPNVLLEAIASGVPVIATDVPGNREVIRNGENGILVERPESLAPAILAFMRDPDLATRMSVAARRTALDRTWAKVAASYAELALRPHPSKPI